MSNLGNILPKSEHPISFYDCSSICVGWEGIKKINDTTYLMIGTALDNKGLIFLGSKNGQGFYITFSVPVLNISNTFCYSGEYLGKGLFRLVGSYKLTTSSDPFTGNASFIYVGKINKVGLSNINNYIIIEPPSRDNNIIIHSVSRNLICGNIDRTIGGYKKNGVIYNIFGDYITDVVYPNSAITNVYAIIFNGDKSYTITGGYSSVNVNGVTQPKALIPGEKGFIVDYNAKTGTFSKWTTVQLPTSEYLPNIFHFEGISKFFNSNNMYSLSFTGLTSVGKTIGGMMKCMRNNNNFQVVEVIPVYYQFNENLVCYGNSIVDNLLIGIRTDTQESGLLCYQAEIIFN